MVGRKEVKVEVPMEVAGYLVATRQTMVREEVEVGAVVLAMAGWVAREAAED